MQSFLGTHYGYLFYDINIFLVLCLFLKVMGTLLTSSKKQKSNSKLFKEENEFSVSVDFQEENIQREVDPGVLTRSERFFFFSISFYLLSVFFSMG